MRLLYDTFFLIFGLLYVPYLLFKRKLHKDFSQRFGCLPDSVTSISKPVWIHAVSVGEARLAVKLASGIKKRFPDHQIVISTTTETGMSVARSAVGDAVDAVFYSPLDVSGIVSGVVRRVNPVLYVMVETELWPNLLGALHEKKVPMIVINGRISDRSFRNYKRIGLVMRRVLKQVDLYCVQSEKDARRITELGAEPRSVCVTGSMKFDGEESAGIDIAQLKKDMGFGAMDRVIVAGSTHFPEEQEIIDVYQKLKKKHHDLKLVLAPRHVERVDAIEIYSSKSGSKHRRFSDINTGIPVDIVIVDTIGHLKDIYAIATVIFVGGSLARKGGQNPIEGARLGKPVIFGPHMFNFREIADIFLDADAALTVHDKDGLFRMFDELLLDEPRRELLGRNAGRIVRENKGAIGRTLNRVEGFLS
ncbi:MAG: 3-deoxy-D-manno-octulosonic acid transferase [Candidatus Omnitrophica bacterium]|nr:3-deoxy-D-manno-octulosonic acid transferase [Candidatus Omnitrophota bacterium]